MDGAAAEDRRGGGPLTGERISPWAGRSGRPRRPHKDSRTLYGRVPLQPHSLHRSDTDCLFCASLAWGQRAPETPTTNEVPLVPGESL